MGHDTRSTKSKAAAFYIQYQEKWPRVSMICISWATRLNDMQERHARHARAKHTQKPFLRSKILSYILLVISTV